MSGFGANDALWSELSEHEGREMKGARSNGPSDDARTTGISCPVRTHTKVKTFLGSLSAIILLVCARGSLAAETETAVFGAGCFWCVEAFYEQQPGVKSVVSGYAAAVKRTRITSR
jgi:hypothetical protein